MKKFAAVLLLLMIFALSGCFGSNKIHNSPTTGSSDVSSQVKVTQTPTAKNEPEKKAPTQSVQKDSVKPTVTQTPTPAPSAVKKDSFTLSITENKGAKVILNREIDITSKESLMEYLKEEASVIDDGGFIKAINNISSISANKLTSEQKKAGVLGVDWFIYVNSKKASTGAYDIYPKKNDLVNLDFKEWGYQDYGK